MPTRENTQEWLDLPAGRLPPQITDLSAFWWDGIRRQELRIQRCNACSELWHLPVARCRRCGSEDLGHIVAAGSGTIYSYVVCHYPAFPGFNYPHVAIVVSLTEGVRVVSELVSCAPEDAEIGMDVRVRFARSSDGLTLAVFEPARPRH